VKGYGFSGNIEAVCRISDYTVSATIISPKKISCSSKISKLRKKEQYNHFVEFSIKIMDRSQENLISFFSYETNSLYTPSAAVFYFYVSANATKIEPTSLIMNEIIELYVYGSHIWSFKNTLVGDSDYPDSIISSYFGQNIYCKFGDFGKTQATYIKENLIKCLVPMIKTNLALIYEVEKTLSLTFNGKTYISNEISVKFIGVTSPILYTWVLLGLFVGVTMMMGLVAVIMNYKRKKEKIRVN